MALFMINQDMTYADSPLVANNRFLRQPAITAICDMPVEIEIHYGGKTKTIYAGPK